MGKGLNRLLLGAVAVLAIGLAPGPARAKPITNLDARIEAIEPKVIAWRRDIHEHPELGNRETRTAKMVADHLRKLGFDEVRTGIAYTGVVGILKGGKPGPVVGLRADMDALPVEEKTGLPFASKAKSTYEGQAVSVMHACGHDTHTAMLLGAAEVLAGMKADIAGTIVFVFQPAEEGAPSGEGGGAKLMLEQQALANPRPAAMFGLHVFPNDSGKIYYRAGGFFAASDRIRIQFTGRQTHGARPWSGVDISSLAAETILSMNQIAARQLNVAKNPTIITIATMHGGVRHNIIPEEVTLTGTLRTFDPAVRTDVIARITHTVENLAESYGAKAKVAFEEPNPVTWNDAALSAWALPSLQRAAGGADRVDSNAELVTGAEDFSYFAKEIPSVYVQLGARPKGADPATVAVNHSPNYDVDEDALIVGVRTHVFLALDYLARGHASPKR